MKTIPILRMDCPTCIPVLEREILKVQGVEDVRGYYMTKTIKVTYNTSKTQVTEIEKAIERLGYRIAYKKYPSPLTKLKSLFNKEEDSGVVTLEDKGFLETLNASKPVVILFSSPTCPSCMIFKPHFTSLAKRHSDKAQFYEMNIEDTNTWRNYDVLSIPQILIFREGKISERITGMPSVNEIESRLEEETNAHVPDDYPSHNRSKADIT
jgi:thiol-disulfide isomerase/thioredoxin